METINLVLVAMDSELDALLHTIKEYKITCEAQESEISLLKEKLH